ncbi:MAG TPA: DUF4430 domain-containing protein [Candidatus Saccharimonadales bacterium]
MGDVETNYTKTTVISILVLIAILASVTVGVLHKLQTNKTAQTSSSTVRSQVQGATIIRFTAVKGESVLAQLQSREKVVVDQDPNYGLFVESINGIKNGADNKYWSYYVNGHITNSGAESYITKGGEEVVWKFE